MKPIYALLASLMIISCKDDEIEIVNLRVNHHRQSAVGFTPTLVFLTQEDETIGSDAWQYHYWDISGFNFEWGYVYDLEISKRHLDNPPADGSSIEYILEKIVSKNPVDENTSFELILKSKTIGIVPSIVVGDAISGFQLMDQTAINCSSLCQELEQTLDAENEVTGLFKYNTSNELLLVELKSE